jgi:hypothetical protein
VITVLAFGVRPPSHIVTRYSLSLYVLALCVGLLAASHLGDVAARRFHLRRKVASIGAVACCLLAFWLSEDLNASHLLHLNSDAVAFRTGQYERFSRHWYSRADFERPAQFVNAAASDGDKIIVSHNAGPTAAYLTADFAIHWPTDNLAFADISRDGGTRDIWSNKKLLSSFDAVAKYAQKTGRVWLILRSAGDPLQLDPERLWPGRVKGVEVYSPGRDGRIEVRRIDLKGPSEMPGHRPN